MPVKNSWYEIKTITGKKDINGILHYGVIFVGGKKVYWTPFYNVNYEGRRWFNEKYSNRQKNQRTLRYIRYCERKWGWQALEEDDSSILDYDSSVSDNQGQDSMDGMSESSYVETPRRIKRKPKWYV